MLIVQQPSCVCAGHVVVDEVITALSFDMLLECVILYWACFHRLHTIGIASGLQTQALSLLVLSLVVR